MKAQANQKCWGIELEISTNSVTIKEDLSQPDECIDISESFLHASKDIFNHARNSNDLEYSKYVIEEMCLNDYEIEQLIEYLQNKL